MDLLNRLLGRKETRTAPATEVVERPCPHGAIVPRWHNAADIGKSEVAASYTCESCDATFSREEGERLLSEASQRLRISDAERL